MTARAVQIQIASSFSTARKKGKRKGGRGEGKKTGAMYAGLHELSYQSHQNQKGGKKKKKKKEEARKKGKPDRHSALGIEKEREGGGREENVQPHGGFPRIDLIHEGEKRKKKKGGGKVNVSMVCAF